MVADSGGVEAPYRGLRPFGEQDEALFFGRERAATRVLELLSERPGLLVVSGVSGVGKSSLLRAGVLPALRRDGLASAPSAKSWPCLVLSPGGGLLGDLADGLATMLRIPASQLRAELAADPANFAALGRQAALSAVPGQYLDTTQDSGTPRPRLLLVVDQCEQLFTQCDEPGRHAFLTALHAAIVEEPDDPSAMVVFVIRSDFEGSLAEYRPEDFPELGQAVQDRYLVRALNERELRMAITGPAAKAGFRVADDLVHVLIDEMRTSPALGAPGGTAIGAGALPMLSHALDQAWRNRSGPNLELADYERIGGIQNAIAVTAGSAYLKLSAEQRVAARSVFIRLVATGGDGADTAIRVPVADLTAALSPAQAADVEAVLKAFVAARLLTMGSHTAAKGATAPEATVEISHESLLIAWPLLRDAWLAKTHADRVTRTRLSNAAAEWRRTGDSSYLYRGTVLQSAMDTAERIAADPVRNSPLSDTERDFLRASTSARRRAVRWRQAAFAALTALTLTAGALALVAQSNGLVAQSNAGTAERSNATALSRQLAAESLAEDQSDPEVAGQLATAAWQESHTAQARDAMLILAASQQRGTLPVVGNDGSVLDVAFSPNGRLLATADSDGTARLWNTATNMPVGKPLPVADDGSAVNGVAFSPNGKLLATADDDGTVQLWNTATRQPGSELLPVDTSSIGSVKAVAFSPDGKLLATADANGTVQLWNTATKQPTSKPLAATIDQSPVNGVAFSPDGRLLATADGDGTVRLWNTATGKPAGNPLPAEPDDEAEAVAFSPNGKLLATADVVGTVQLWNTATRQPAGPSLPGDSIGGMDGVAFSPDGKLLAATGDGAVRLWNTATWKLADNSLPASPGDQVGVKSVAFSPDGKLLATADANGTVQLWNTATGSDGMTSFPPGILPGDRGVALSPDGRLLATADMDGTARLWNTATGEPAGAPIPADTSRLVSGVNSVAFSPDGRLLATADQDGTVRLWNTTTGKPAGAPFFGTNGQGAVYGVAFSPDGRLLVTAGGTGIRLWNPATRKPVIMGKSGGNTLPVTSDSSSVIGVAFSPDGKLLAIATSDGKVRLWNPANLSAEQSADSTLTVTPAGDGAAGVAFIPESDLLATVDQNGTVRLWDPTTGQSIGPSFPDDIIRIQGVASGPDGTLLTVSLSVERWRMSLLSDPYQVLCADFGGISQGQWNQYAQGATLPTVCGVPPGIGAPSALPRQTGVHGRAGAGSRDR